LNRRSVLYLAVYQQIASSFLLPMTVCGMRSVGWGEGWIRKYDLLLIVSHPSPHPTEQLMIVIATARHEREAICCISTAYDKAIPIIATTALTDFSSVRDDVESNLL